MNRIGRVIRGLFDVRSGEHLRLWAMFFYLLFVLFAYYIVKPVSRAMFLTKFDVDKLPLLYILIAIFGGILAYFYSRLATRLPCRFLGDGSFRGDARHDVVAHPPSDPR